MPNWAEGFVVVKGSTVKDVKEFMLHFLSNTRQEILIEAGMDSDYPYFARSFLDVWETISYIDLFNEIDEDEDENGLKSYRLEFDVNFAWGAGCCLIDVKGSYLRENDGTRAKGLISLPEACIAHNVEVELFTEEPGMCFQEHLRVNPQGQILVDESVEIKIEEDESGETETIGGYQVDGFWQMSI